MKKRRVLIVDGYNVLNAWKNVQGMDAGSLSDARDALAARLMDYAGFSGQKVVLVYDAYLGDRRTRTEEQTGPLTVVYTQKNETADNYIERLCDQYARDAELGRVEVRVATSDLVEQMVVLGRHATRMSARELLVEVGQVSRAGRERMSARPKNALGAHRAPARGRGPQAGGHASGRRASGGQMTLMYYERFEPMTDEEIVALAQAGDGAALEFLLNKYKNFVRTKARSYFLIGADHEDIVQEGMIGLYKAIRDFKSEKLTSFRAFAELCVTRQIITAIKTATRQKHIPLNSYVSLNKPIYDEESDRTLLDVISEEVPSDPEAMLIDREDLSFIEGRIGEMLSDLEKQVLVLYMEGKSYVEISRAMGRHVKSVDNALQRIKRKLQKYLEKK